MELFLFHRIQLNDNYIDVIFLFKLFSHGTRIIEVSFNDSNYLLAKNKNQINKNSKLDLDLLTMRNVCHLTHGKTEAHNLKLSFYRLTQNVKKTVKFHTRL